MRLNDGEVLFIGALLLFYRHWVAEQKEEAIESLNAAVAAHVELGDEATRDLARRFYNRLEKLAELDGDRGEEKV